MGGVAIAVLEENSELAGRILCSIPEKPTCYLYNYLQKLEENTETKCSRIYANNV
jgi:hypothetical protein